MSIKGFEVGGVQERYDYTALDNTPANLVQDGNYVHTDNNFTNADKTKLDGIEANANKTVIDATLTQSGQAADAKATGDELDDLKSALDTKANINGSYIDMTVGNAKQLVSTVGVTDRTPYTFRTAGGSADIGDRAVDKLVGGTICWNQLKRFSEMNPKSGNGYVTVKNADSFTTKYDGTSYDNWAGLTSPYVRADHVYLFRAKVLPSFDTKVGFTGAGDICPTICPPNEETTVSAIRKPSSEIYGEGLSTTVAIKAWEASVQRGVSIPAGATVTIREFECFDLTQMFGAQIADRVYTLEQATPGAGVVWFKKLFPKPYYAYNPGELISVKAAARRTVGFNAYDHAAGKAKLVGGMPYQITGAYTALTLNGEAIAPDAGGYFTPAGSGELTVTGGDSATTCVHLVWDGERDGEYAPYEEHSYPLDDTLTLHGVPKLDSGDNLYFDGDTYESDGTVTRKYGVVDLGTLNWTYDSSVPRFYSTDKQNEVVKPSSSVVGNIVCDKYTSTWANNIWASGSDKIVAISSGGAINVKDTAYTTTASFKTAMSGVYLVYELAEPTTEEADPYQNPQIVNDFGTEEYIVTEQSGVAVPVGHVTTYPANLRDKLQHLPDLADADGYYMIQQTNNDMSLIRFRIPQAPTTDGEYILKATVSGGTPTYTWEANA